MDLDSPVDENERKRLEEIESAVYYAIGICCVFSCLHKFTCQSRAGKLIVLNL